MLVILNLKWKPVILKLLKKFQKKKKMMKKIKMILKIHILVCNKKKFFMKKKLNNKILK